MRTLGGFLGAAAVQLIGLLAVAVISMGIADRFGPGIYLPLLGFSIAGAFAVALWRVAVRVKRRISGARRADESDDVARVFD